MNKEKIQTLIYSLIGIIVGPIFTYFNWHWLLSGQGFYVALSWFAPATFFGSVSGIIWSTDNSSKKYSLKNILSTLILIIGLMLATYNSYLMFTYH